MGTQFFWIFDAAVAAILLGFIFMGIRKGFVSVLLSLLALILAFAPHCLPATELRRRFMTV